MQSEVQKLNDRRFNESIALMDLSFEDSNKQAAVASPQLQSSPLYRGPEVSHDGMLNSWRCLAPNPVLQHKKRIGEMIEMRSNSKQIPGLMPSKFSVQKQIDNLPLARNSRVVLRSFHQKTSHGTSFFGKSPSFVQETPTSLLHSAERRNQRGVVPQANPSEEFIFKIKGHKNQKLEKKNLTTIDLIFVPPADDQEISHREDGQPNQGNYLPIPSITTNRSRPHLRRKQASHSTDKTPRDRSRKIADQPYFTERLAIDTPAAKKREASRKSPADKHLLPELEILPVGYGQPQSGQGRWKERVVEKHKLSAKMTSYKKLKQAVIISQSHINSPMVQEPQTYDWGGKSGVLSRLIQQAVTDLAHDDIAPAMELKKVHQADLNNKTLRSDGEHSRLTKPSAGKLSTQEELNKMGNARSDPSLGIQTQPLSIGQSMESHSAVSAKLFPDSSLFKQKTADSSGVDRLLNISHGSVGYQVIQDVLEALVEKRKAISKPPLSLTKNQSSQGSTLRPPSQRVFQPQVGEKSTEKPGFRVQASSKRPLIRLPESMSSVLQMPTRPSRPVPSPGASYPYQRKAGSVVPEITGNKLNDTRTPSKS